MSDSFYEELILDLIVLAERFGADSKKDSYERYVLKYLKRKHPRNYNWRVYESVNDYKCPVCGYFHSSLYIRGVKPKKCFKCHFNFR